MSKPSYRSQAEERFAKVLKDNSIVFKYEYEKLPYEMPAVTKKYLPDFKVGTETYIEFKGYFSGRDRKKLLAVKATNPGIDLRIVFQADNILSSKKTKIKKRYSDWARLHGFPFHVGISLPQEWIDEFKEAKIRRARKEKKASQG
jgi:hypothetical protein